MSELSALHIDGETGAVTEVSVDDAARAFWAEAAAAAASPAALVPPLLVAASTACDALIAQVVPSETHKLAYGNAAAIVLANGGKAPTDDPAKTIFATLATSVGMEPDAFAVVAQEVSLVSLQLAAVLSGLRAACGGAKAAADLATALAAFESALSDVVAKLSGAGLTVSISVPDAIRIAGVNA